MWKRIFFFFTSTGIAVKKKKMLLLLLFGILKENSRYCKAFVNENKHPESHSFGVFIAYHIKNIVASYILHSAVCYLYISRCTMRIISVDIDTFVRICIHTKDSKLYDFSSDHV